MHVFSDQLWRVWRGIVTSDIVEHPSLIDEISVFNVTRQNSSLEIFFCAVHQYTNEPRDDGPDLLSKSVADSDQKFWAGQRRLSFAQWAGVALMFVVGFVVATSSGYRAFAVIFGALLLFVLLGHLLAQKKTRTRQ